MSEASLRDAWNRLQEIVQNEYAGCDRLKNAMNDVAGAIAAEIVCRPAALSQEAVRDGALEELAAGNGVYYVAQERAMASGISEKWPGVIQHPTNANGRLVKREFNSLQTSAVLEEIMQEVQRAAVKFPTWPTDPLHALAVLGEEFGELTKAMLQLIYEPDKTSKEEVRKEALQTAAMAYRLYASLGHYDYKRGPQHEQTALKREPNAVEPGASDE